LDQQFNESVKGGYEVKYNFAEASSMQWKTGYQMDNRPVGFVEGC